MAETFDRLNDDAIRNLVGAELFAEGLVIYQAGRVLDREQQPGDSFSAVVVHSSSRQYLATVFQEQGGLYAECDCSRRRQGACVHVTAVLIAWAREPESFAEAEDLEDDYDDDDDADYALGGGEADEALPLATALAAEPRPVETWAERSKREYARCLDWLTVPVLREVAQRRGVAISGNRKTDIIATLAEALSRPGAVAAVWPTLSPAARLAGNMVALLRNQYGVYVQHLRDAVRQVDPKAQAALSGALEELQQAGLCFNTPYGSIDCPVTLAGELPPDAEYLSPAPGTHAPAHPAEPLAFALLATRILLTLQAAGDWRARPAQPVHPLGKQFPVLQPWPYDPAEFDALARERNVAQRVYGARLSIPPLPPPLEDAARATLARTLGVDPEQVDFAVRLLADLGLIQLAPGQPVTVAGPRIADFLRQAPLGRTAQLYNAWMSMQRWAEFDLVPAGAGEPRLKRLGSPGGLGTYAALLGAFAGARNYLLLLLRRAPAGQWTNFNALLARAYALRINPAVLPLGPGCYAEIDGQPVNAAESKYWNPVYGAYAAAVLAGPLHWLGAIEVAFEAKGSRRLAAFRITDLGALLFGQRSDYTAAPAAPASGPALTYTAEGDLCVQIETAAPELIALLAQLCSARSDPEGRLIYRPTAAGAARIFEAGGDVPGLLAAFERAAGAPPPESLAATLRAWGENFGAVHLYRDVALIELADDYALGELLAGTSLAQHILYRFNPRLIAVRPEGVEALRAELIKKGYTPKVEGQ